MIEILRYLNDPKPWNYGLFLIMGNADYIIKRITVLGH